MEKIKKAVRNCFIVPIVISFVSLIISFAGVTIPFGLNSFAIFVGFFVCSFLFERVLTKQLKEISLHAYKEMFECPSGFVNGFRTLAYVMSDKGNDIEEVKEVKKYAKRHYLSAILMFFLLIVTGILTDFM